MTKLKQTKPRFKIGDIVVAPSGRIRVITNIFDKDQDPNFGRVLTTVDPYDKSNVGMGYEKYYRPIGSGRFNFYFEANFTSKKFFLND